MRLAITQPTFMPWCGYFALMENVDEIVFLDDVQFNKRSWQQRNKIKFNDKELILTIPVYKKKLSKQLINEVQINRQENYIHNHLRSITLAYCNSQYYENYFYDIKKIYNNNYSHLLSLNLDLIKLIKKFLKINTTISFSSDLNINSKKENLINEICIKKNCTSYISTIGSNNYLSKLKKTKYKISYYGFQNKDYEQKGKIFIPNMSIIDLLFNMGDKAKKYLNKNFYLID